MPVSSEEFKRALSARVAGVAIVTSRAADRIAGMTVTDWTGVSLDPPLVLVCISETSRTLEVVEAGKCFAINVLAAEQRDLSDRFASKENEWQRFDGLELESGTTGAPLLKDALACLDCRVVSAYEAGDHWLFVGQIEGVVTREGAPLVYWGAGYRRLASSD
jgi:flavin reductase